MLRIHRSEPVSLADPLALSRSSEDNPRRGVGFGPWRSGGLLLAAATALLLLACSSDEGDPGDGSIEPTGEVTATSPATATSAPNETSASTSTPTGEPTSTQPTVVDPVPVDAIPAFEGIVLDRPVEALSYPLGGYELAVADQSGVVYGLREGEATPILDLSGQVLRQGNEEGLLSVALGPGFEENRHVWAYYSAANPRRSVLSRFTANEDGSIDPATELVVLEQEQPASNHNGGAIRFGPDGMLYLGLGDGGNQGDPNGHGQDLAGLLGSILRLDVSEASPEEPYRIPDDNPFVGQEGARGEIYAYGLRNPWRTSFDSATGELWVADVGQGTYEEVNRVQAGDNLGWNQVEGPECYLEGCDPSQYVAPVAWYDHSGGRCSVTGGVVVRDAAVTSLEGAYVYGDYCSGDLWAVRSDTTGGTEPVLIASGLGNISSIAQIEDEVYVLAFGQPMYRLADQ